MDSYILTPAYEALVKKATEWCRESIFNPRETQKHNSVDGKPKEFGVAISDEDLTLIQRRLRKQRMTKIHYDGDSEPTVFRMVDGQLTAFDSRFPGGRRVMSRNQIMSSQDYRPLSCRAIFSHIFMKFNTQASEGANTAMGYLLDADLPDGISVLAVCSYLTAMLMYASENNIRITPGHKDEELSRCYVVAMPVDTPLTIVQNFKDIFHHTFMFIDYLKTKATQTTETNENKESSPRVK